MLCDASSSKYILKYLLEFLPLGFFHQNIVKTAILVDLRLRCWLRCQLLLSCSVATMLLQKSSGPSKLGPVCMGRYTQRTGDAMPSAKWLLQRTRILPNLQAELNTVAQLFEPGRPAHEISYGPACCIRRRAAITSWRSFVAALTSATSPRTLSCAAKVQPDKVLSLVKPGIAKSKDSIPGTILRMHVARSCFPAIAHTLLLWIHFTRFANTTSSICTSTVNQGSRTSHNAAAGKMSAETYPEMTNRYPEMTNISLACK